MKNTLFAKLYIPFNPLIFIYLPNTFAYLSILLLNLSELIALYKLSSYLFLIILTLILKSNSNHALPNQIPQKQINQKIPQIHFFLHQKQTPFPKAHLFLNHLQKSRTWDSMWTSHNRGGKARTRSLSHRNPSNNKCWRAPNHHRVHRRSFGDRLMATLCMHESLGLLNWPLTPNDILFQFCLSTVL